MATITIRNLDDSVKQRWQRVQAASHNRSMTPIIWVPPSRTRVLSYEAYERLNFENQQQPAKQVVCGRRPHRGLTVLLKPQKQEKVLKAKPTGTALKGGGFSFSEVYHKLKEAEMEAAEQKERITANAGNTNTRT
jgi:hypothetical protein